MIGPVNVLAALQQIADGDGDVELLAMRVRTAVAELIVAAQDVIDDTVNAGAYPDGPCISRKERDALKLALDRVGGAS